MKKIYIIPAIQETTMNLGHAIANGTGVNGDDGTGWGGVDEGGLLDPESNDRGNWEDDFWDCRE